MMGHFLRLAGDSQPGCLALSQQVATVHRVESNIAIAQVLTRHLCLAATQLGELIVIGCPKGGLAVPYEIDGGH
jgi:hypothetical protein